MKIEIQKPELAQRVQAQIQSGHFHNADELIGKGLDALDEQTTADVSGAVVLAALQASAHGISTSRRSAYALPVCATSCSDEQDHHSW
jgi:Arc/MetJ-type ribon-helix-helix transcriptional regulator